MAESVGKGRLHACPSSYDPAKGGYETRPYKASHYDSGRSVNFETVSEPPGYLVITSGRVSPGHMSFIICT